MVRDEILGIIWFVFCYLIIFLSKGFVEFYIVGGEKGENVCKIIGLIYRKISFFYDLFL